jgi:monoamine oxidase
VSEHLSRRQFLGFLRRGRATETGRARLLQRLDTVVVGAGVAGLAAARLLHFSGRRVVVLEARERLGGRVWTDRAWGAPMELGASRLHAPSGSSLAALLGQFALPTSEEVPTVLARSELDLASDPELVALGPVPGALAGGAGVRLPEGCDRLVEALAQELDVRTQHQVQSISYDAAGVVVRTDRGDFEAGRVVVAVPLGVLKRGAIVFDPALPERKAHAIRRIAVGVANRLYLRFPRAFWASCPRVVNVPERAGQWLELLASSGAAGPVVSGWIAGLPARMQERWPDEQVVRDAMRVVRLLEGGAAAEPEAWRITRWGLDPHAGGTVSFLAGGAAAAERGALAEPLGRRLFFAGEATSSEAAATVHGALDSGERAAQHIAAVD